MKLTGIQDGEKSSGFILFTYMNFANIPLGDCTPCAESEDQCYTELTKTEYDECLEHTNLLSRVDPTWAIHFHCHKYNVPDIKQKIAKEYVPSYLVRYGEQKVFQIE
jgi:hypothetical protein